MSLFYFVLNAADSIGKGQILPPEFKASRYVLAVEAENEDDARALIQDAFVQLSPLKDFGDLNTASTHPTKDGTEGVGFEPAERMKAITLMLREILTLNRLPFIVLLATCGCTKEQQKPQTESTSAHQVSSISVPRGIPGLELGMTPQQIDQLFAIKEDEDPVASLLNKYGKQDAGKAISRQSEIIQKRFFRVSSAVGKFPDGVTSADARVTHNIVYEIGLHYSFAYDEASVKKIRWRAVTYPLHRKVR